MTDSNPQISPARGELRKFGFVVGGVFTVIGLWLQWRGKAAAPFFLVPGVALMLAGWLVPNWLRRVHRGWFLVGHALGYVMSRLILTLFFYLIITPVGVVARLLGNDFLQRRRDPTATSYWVRRPPPPPREGYERQY